MTVLRKSSGSPLATSSNILVKDETFRCGGDIESRSSGGGAVGGSVGDDVWAA